MTHKIVGYVCCHNYKILLCWWYTRSTIFMASGHPRRHSTLHQGVVNVTTSDRPLTSTPISMTRLGTVLVLVGAPCHLEIHSRIHSCCLTPCLGNWIDTCMTRLWKYLINLTAFGVMEGPVMSNTNETMYLAQGVLVLALLTQLRAWVCLPIWAHPVVHHRGSAQNLVLDRVVDVMVFDGRAVLRLRLMALPIALGPAWIRT